MAPYLLTLPGEIRNQIYEYVLTKPNGVVCVKDSHGVSRLINYKEDIKSLWGIDRLSCVVDGMQENGDPGRLHETESGRAYAEKLDKIEPPEETNHLRYVNKQLKKETHKLVVRFNLITFISPGDTDSMAKCAEFLRSYTQRPARLQALIVGMTISNADSSTYDEANPFVKEVQAFCYANPQVPVHVRDNVLSQTLGQLLPNCLWIAYVLGREMELIQRMKKCSAKTNEAMIARMKLVGRTSVPFEYARQLFGSGPPNMRYFPRETSFDEIVFRNTLRHDLPVQSILQDFDIGEDALVEMAEDIYEKGL
ncbi:hypothetical protein P280DRAFT_526680 [Massarina eburnea CBS 473.64]|uniref:Uncharacterized protein n=1 Tax=Massarina eburnea CBS 473.64 TaxID=1395130 RepID=A0A6A6RYR1_9PLEO|nr:hypothetical protein P280DRAFT_526680 [Massarina eburnea CBS 473.64]